MNMKRKFILFFMLLASCAVFAQVRYGLIPNGTWVLEPGSVRAITGCNHTDVDSDHAHEEVDMSLIDVEIYTELEATQDAITLKSSKNTLHGGYRYEYRVGLVFDAAIPFSGGEIVAGKLYVRQLVDNPLSENLLLYVTFTYVPKK